jgi:ubiquinone/menaquinone biosynthesis C-methylase UbiE
MYWDTQYLEYWKTRTAEAETTTQSQIVIGDKTTTSTQVYYALLDRLAVAADDVVLELGCGLGRSFDYLVRRSRQVYGVDISTAMVLTAYNTYRSVVNGLVVAEAEHLPFLAAAFTKIVCFAVFDALDQTQTLLEMNTLLTVGGDVLITGKNTDYAADDELAYIAEVNARAKGHPNYFTDVAALLQALPILGFSLVNMACYARRGDLATHMISTVAVNQFYEYCVILRKVQPANREQCLTLKLSAEYSQTFLRKSQHA